MEKKSRVRLELFRNGEVKSYVEPDTEEGTGEDDDFNVQVRHNINEIPICNIRSKRPDVNISFMEVSDGDIIRVSVARDENQEYTELFKGEFYKKNVSYNREEGEYFKLDLLAVHSFWNLQRAMIRDVITFKDASFSDIINDMVKQTRVQSCVEISESLAHKRITGYTQNTNAFRLFKEVCLLKNAIVQLHLNNNVTVMHRDEFIKRIMSSKPLEIDLDKDVKSWQVK